MKKTILISNPIDNSINKIEYKYYKGEEPSLNLVPSAAAAYWWVERLRNLARFVAKNRKDPRYAIYLCYLAIVEDFDERDWRKLYMCLAKMFRIRMDNLPNNVGEYRQGTAKGEHDDINNVLFYVATNKYHNQNIAVLDLNLTTRYQVEAQVCVRDSKAFVEKDGDVEDIRDSFIGECGYDYILTGDEVRLGFSRLVRAVIVLLAKFDKLDTFSINRIRINFCRAYIDYYDSNVDEEELSGKVVDNNGISSWGEFCWALNHLRIEGMDIKSDMETNRYVYHPNPLDENGLDGDIINAATYIARAICDSKVARKHLGNKISQRPKQKH